MKTPCPDCEKVKENVSALFDGELSHDEAEKLTARIQKCADEGCRECIGLLEDLKKMKHICNCPEAECPPPKEVVEDLRKRVMASLDGSHGSR